MTRPADTLDQGKAAARAGFEKQLSKINRGPAPGPVPRSASFDDRKAAVLAQRLRLLDNGYRITPIRTWGAKGAGKAPYLRDWQKIVVTAGDVPAWGASSSTGIVCGTQLDGSDLVAIDIDVLDHELALEIQQQALDMLGDNSLLRIGRAPKRLLLYRCAYAATKLHFAEGGIEILGEGNQFVAFGIHPDTRRPYLWPAGDTPENTPLDSVPTTTPHRVGAFVRWLERRLTRLKPAEDPQFEGQHDDQPIVAGEDGLIRDGRERLLRDIVWRAFQAALPNPTLEGITSAAWSTFRQRAFLGDGKWKLRDCTTKVRGLMRRWKAGEIGQKAPATTPHWPQQPEIDAEELNGRIDADLADFAAGQSMVQTYPPGSGKTTKAIRAASHMPGRTLVFMPTKRLTAEHAQRVQHSDDVPVATVFGRSPDNCANHPVVEAAAERGINIEANVCAHCPFKAACRSTPGQYFKQFDTNAATVLLSSAYLARELPARLGMISRIVIDELPDFVGFGELPLAALLETRAHGFNEKRNPAVIDLLAASQKARDALEAKDLSTLDADTCTAMASLEWNFKAQVPDLEGLDTAAQLAALARMPVDHAPRLSSFWKALAENVRRGELATMWTGADKATERVMVRWIYLKRPVLPEGVPVLLLDGTVHPEIARAVFGPELEIRSASVKRNLTVIQVADVTVSKRYLENSKTALPAIRRFAEAWGMPVIGNKQFDDRLGSAAHFGALRGLNALEDEPALAVVGHMQLPPVEAERIAMLLWPDKPILRAGNYERRPRGYRMRDGSRRGAKVDVHADPLAQAVVEHFREGGSTIQGADRLRSIHQEGKTLVLFDNLPVDLTVDHLVTMDELLDPLTIMAGRGVIPAHPVDLATAHPDLFATPKAARLWLDRGGLKKPQIPIEVLIGNRGFLVRVRYRAAAGGYTRAAWVNRARAADPRAWLEARLGPLVYFEGDDLPPARPPAGSRPAAEKPAPATAPAPMGEAGPPIDAGQAAPDDFPDPPMRDQGEAGPMPRHGPRFMVPPIAGPPVIRADLAADPYWTTGGIMPPELVAFSRGACRASGWTQQVIADRAGLSRPQFANAMQGRFGLSAAAAGRWRDALTALPDRAPDLFDWLPTEGPRHDAR